MALKQSRRTVSLRRDTYERALDFANAQHLSLAELVTLGLKAIGVDVGEQQHRPIEHTRLAEHARNRATRIMARRNGIQAPTIPGVFTNPPAVESRGGGELRAVETGTPDNMAPEHAEPSPAATSSRRTHTAVAYHASQVVSP